MIRFILVLLLFIFLVIGGTAVALYHFFGWKGFIAFPFLLLIVVWLLKKVAGKVFKRIALGLFGVKAHVLRGASMTVHSIKSIPKPTEPDSLPDAGEESDEGRDDDDALNESDETPDPKDYVEADITITPKSAANNDAVWEPGELMLATQKVKSLEDLEDKEAGTTHSVEIWNGSEFGPDDPGKYPGEQRLKIIFAVKPGTRTAWLQYYNEPIGELRLPPGTIEV